MSAPEASQPYWYCVRAQPKREHLAAGSLRLLEGVEVFCPRLRYRKATRRGVIWWLEPLFPSYVLARFVLAEMERAVMFAQGVTGLVRFGGEVPPVPDSFVEALRREYNWDADASEILTLTPQIESGEEVEVASGPLAGMTGVVVEIAPASERVKVLMDFLGQPHVVDIDLFSILLPRKPRP
jgi:transcriptional antiterminator RfaH